MILEFPNAQSGFRKVRGTRDQIAKSVGLKIKKSSEKSREFQKNIYFCFIDYAKAVEQQTGKFLKRMKIADHFLCLLRNLYACQEATVRTRRGKTDRLQIGKGVHQG